MKKMHRYILSFILMAGILFSVSYAAFAAESVLPEESEEGMETEDALEAETVSPAEAVLETEVVSESETNLEMESCTEAETFPQSPRANTYSENTVLNGFMTDSDGNTFYYVSGKPYKGEKPIGSHWYYFDETTGSMATGWTEHHGNRYYYNEKGWMLYGQQTIDGRKYNFDKVTGVLLRDVERVEGGHWVYYGNDGAMVTGWAEHHGNRYYYNEKGWMLYGQQTIDGKKYYFDLITGVMYKGEKVIGGHWVYYGNDGAMATGWTEHHGNRYYYNERGWMLYGRQEIDGKEWNFDEVTGALIHGFQKINDKVYYVDKIANLYKGEQKIGDKVFLFDASTGELKQGLQTVGDKKYYYVNEAPYVLTGEKVLNGKWHYFDEKTGEMAVGWSGHHGNRYYYNSNGEMLYGKQSIDGKEYCFNTITGALVYDSHSIMIPDLYGKGLMTFNSGNSLTPEMQRQLNDAIYAITGKGYNVGFVVVDLYTGQGISYNGNQNYYSASTIKGPYVVCLNETVPWSKNQWSGAMTNAIKVSSNSDYHALRGAFGAGQFSGWLEDAGCGWVNAYQEYTTITPKALSQLWVKNYGYFTSNKENSMWCAELFTSTKNSFISQTLSSEYKVYSKAGWLNVGGYYNNQNDAGIIMKDGNPYVVTVLSNAYGRQDLLGNLVTQLDKAHSEMVK